MVLSQLTMFTATLPQTANFLGQNCFTPFLVLKMFSSFYELTMNSVFFSTAAGFGNDEHGLKQRKYN